MDLEKLLNWVLIFMAFVLAVMAAFVTSLVSTAVMIMFSLTILEYRLPDATVWAFAGFAFGFSVVELFKMMLED
jgi:hypothetical protein